MRIQLTRALPQPSLGKVIPAGIIIEAPPGLSERLLRSGGGKPVYASETPERSPEAPESGTSTAPEEAPVKARKTTRKKAKGHG